MFVDRSCTRRGTRLRRLALASAFLVLGGRLSGITAVAQAQWLSIGPSGSYEGGGALATQAGSPEVIYTGTYGGGVFKSVNGGLSWVATNTGLGDMNVTTLATDPASPSTIYAGTQTRGVFKSTNGGATWSAANNALPAFVPYLAIESSGSAVYAGTREGVFKTTDAGITWVPVNDGLTDRYLFSLEVDRTTPLTVYAGTSSGVFKSVNGGGHWVAVYGQIYQGVSAIGIAPTAPSIVYGGTVYVGPSPGIVVGGFGFLKSVNGGVSWAPANSDQTVGLAVSAIAVDPRLAATVYAGTFNAGVFRSTDGGTSWTALNGGLTDPRVSDILINAQGTVYVGTVGAGVFKLSEGSGTCVADQTTLCLNSGRFQVRVAWRAPMQGSSSAGTAAPLTADAGTFWFFTSNNVELVVKVVDGRAFNNKFWIFYGALTNVEYTITVTDTQTGSVQTYFNPQGQLASVADTAAF